GGDVADYRQAQTGAAGLSAASTIDPVEPFEDPLQITGGDARSVVRDRQVHPGTVGARREVHRTAGLGVLHGVVEQVVGRGHELSAVAHHSQTGGDLRHFERDVAPLGGAADTVDRLGHQQVHGDL